MEISRIGQGSVLQTAVADVGVTRERVRRSRLVRLAVLLTPVAAVLVLRALAGHTITPGMPSLPAGLHDYLPALGLITILGIAVLLPLMGAGRSPHVLYRASEIDISLDDVKGAGVVVEEVVKTLNLFLAHRTFRERMGGTARKA